MRHRHHESLPAWALHRPFALQQHLSSTELNPSNKGSEVLKEMLTVSKDDSSGSFVRILPPLILGFERGYRSGGPLWDLWDAAFKEVSCVFA